MARTSKAQPRSASRSLRAALQRAAFGADGFCSMASKAALSLERLLCAAAGVTSDAATPASACPRLGGISFLHRFGSALNHHVHLHACVTDGVFRPAAADAACDTPPTFLPARPISQANLAALTERVRRRAIRWFRMQRLLDAAAAADMLDWENSGFSVDASVRITLLPPQVRV